MLPPRGSEHSGPADQQTCFWSSRGKHNPAAPCLGPHGHLDARDSETLSALRLKAVTLPGKETARGLESETSPKPLPGQTRCLTAPTGPPKGLSGTKHKPPSGLKMLNAGASGPVETPQSSTDEAVVTARAHRPATRALDAGPLGWHPAQPGHLPPTQAPSAGSTAAWKAHCPRSRRGAGRGPPRLRTTPSHRPSESGRTQRHVTAASVQDGGYGQAPQAPCLGPSPCMRPLSAQARALDRWAGTGLPHRAAQGQDPCFQSLLRAMRLLNGEAPRGWRLQRPLVAPPPGIGSFGSQRGSRRVGEGGQGWSIPAVRRASGLVVGLYRTRGGNRWGCTLDTSGPMKGQPGAGEGREEGGAEP